MPLSPLPTIEALAAELAAGRTSSVALTIEALARASDPAGEGARVFTELDSEQALMQAQASDSLRAAGLARSALDGLPVSMKDLFDFAGRTTRAGSVVLNDAPPAVEDATVLSRLRAAGAVIVGRTNMTEFAYSGLGMNPHHGTPSNPWDRQTGRIPGGSSSGAAVSVCDGMAVAAIGTDTGGSVRIPSALCGLTGFKPTARRVTMRGVLPLSPSLDSVGPLAASVRCCMILDACLSGQPLAPAEATDLTDIRLAIPTDLVLNDMDSEVAAAFDKACQSLSAAGARLHHVAVPEFNGLPAMQARGSFTATEAWAWHRELIASQGKAYDRRVGTRIELGAKVLAADYIALLAARQRWISAVQARVMHFDAMLMPTVPLVAPAIADLAQDDEAYFRANGLMLRNPTLINMLDGCALSLPCHAPGQPPVGLSLAGLAGQDQRILSLGLAVEALLASAPA